MKSSRHAEREREGLWNLFFCCCSLLGYKVLIFENQMSEREKVNLRFVLLLTNGSCWGESSEGGKVNEGGRATFRRKWEETTCCFFLLFFSPVLEQRASFLLCVQIRPENAKIEKEEAKEKLSSADLYVRRVSGVTGALELSQPVLTQVTGRKPVSTGKHTSSSLSSLCL